MEDRLIAKLELGISRGASLNDVQIFTEAREEILRLRKIIDTPETDDFISAVSREAEHQKTRWGKNHDKDKTVWDWFWLIGYLSQKAASATTYTKRKHHMITTAAALKNWHELEHKKMVGRG